MKFAPHRSVTFRMGVLFMALIVWAWWDSLRYETVAGWTPPREASYWTLSSGAGAIVVCELRLRDKVHPVWVKFGHQPPRGLERSPVSDARLREVEGAMKAGLFGRLYRVHSSPSTSISHFVDRSWLLSYRAVMLVYLVVWGSLLAWSWQRRKELNLITRD